jgi:hypothetical protein
MAIKKIITVDGIEVPFKASATLPRLYRAKFRKDIFKDFSALKDSVDESDEENSGLGIESLEVFENIAWTMAKHADPENVPDSPDEWLEQFNTFSIYEVLPQLFELWGVNLETQAESKKSRPVDREMTTPLFLLRCVQIGLSLSDLDLLTIGMVNEMFIEKDNDDYDYPYKATQSQMDAF